MSKLEIYKKDLVIASELERCPQFLTVLDDLFTQLSANDLNPGIENIEEMISAYLGRKEGLNNEFENKLFVSNFLKNLIVELNYTQSQTVLGMRLNKSKFAELVELDPDFVETIYTIMSGVKPNDGKYFPYFDFDSETSTVTLKIDYETLITENNTVYAIGDKQIEVTQMLLDMMVSLENYKTVTKKSLAGDAIPGIVFYSGRYEIEVNFIRQF